MRVYWKIQFLGGAHEKPIGENYPKKGVWTVCRFKRGLGEKEGAVFLWGG